MFSFVKKQWGLVLILLFSIIPLLPLFHTGFFPIHDNTQIARVFEMGKALHDGMLPARWVQDLGYGYGYPIFTFYAPLAFYVGGIFAIVGFSSLIATKIMMGIGIVLSGICMYLFARSIWGETGGVVSGIMYLYAPYHALDIYVRGDVAEFWAYAFLPLLWYGVWKATQTHKIRFVAIGALGFAGVILSHNLTALMVTPFVLGFGIVLIFLSKQKLRTTCYVLLTTILGLTLSAFYWLPVPFEMHFTNVLSQITGGADFHKNFVCMDQLWYSPWGYGGSAAGCVDGISFALGKIYIAFFVCGILLTPFIVKKNRTKGILLIASSIGAILATFLLLEWSQPVWNAVHVMSFLQYPWRFLLLVFFFISFLSGAGFWYLEHATVKRNYLYSFVLSLITSILLISIQGKYFTPQNYLPVVSNVYTNRTALEWITSRITDEYMPQGFHKPQKVQDIVSQNFLIASKTGTILSSTQKTQEKDIVIHMNMNGSIFVNLAYFPGWHAFIDGKEAPFMLQASGVSLPVNSGIHTIKLVYKDTFVETIGDIITLVSMCAIILAIIRSYLSKKI